MDEPAIEIEAGYWVTSSTACWRCGHPAAFAVLVATAGTEWLDGEASPIDEPLFVNEIGDLPDEPTAQVRDLVPSICRPDEDDPSDYLRNRCSYCEALLSDWHLCKIGGALIAEDGTPNPGATATKLAATPIRLNDCCVHYTDVQVVLDAAQIVD
jgi:hypothetical protein